MFKIVRDLFRYNREFAGGAILMALILGMATLSAFSPYPPADIYVVAPDISALLGPSLRHQFARSGRVLAAHLRAEEHARVRLRRRHSQPAALAADRPRVGLPGGFTDRVLMSINDTFIVIPLFPLLILFYFVMRDYMNWALLALVIACLGWAYDARLIRSLMLSLKTREFTRTSVFSGMRMHEIVARSICPTFCRSSSRPRSTTSTGRSASR